MKGKKRERKKGVKKLMKPKGKEGERDVKEKDKEGKRKRKGSIVSRTKRNREK